MKLPEAILKKLNLSEAEFIGQGMESVTYSLGQDRVIKIYETKRGIGYLNKLKRFYYSLEYTFQDFDLPKIYSTEVIMDYIVVQEKKLKGKQINIRGQANIENEDIDTYLESYLSALLKISEISTDFLEKTEVLDNSGKYLVEVRSKDWNQVLYETIKRQDKKLSKVISSKVDNYEKKLMKLLKTFEGQYMGEYSLIHGDFFPENLLFNEDYSVSAVLDFGALTTKGDYLFDVATGWLFLDMYDEVKNYNLKKLLFEKIVSKIGKENLPLLYSYVLAYSFISANMYSDSTEDGHFQWCINNLNNDEYWG